MWEGHTSQTRNMHIHTFQDANSVSTPFNANCHWLCQEWKPTECSLMHGGQCVYVDSIDFRDGFLHRNVAGRSCFSHPHSEYGLAKIPHWHLLELTPCPLFLARMIWWHLHYEEVSLDGDSHNVVTRILKLITFLHKSTASTVRWSADGTTKLLPL